MSEVTIVRAVKTCGGCPSQWDAWDTDGNYWYLRYRYSWGTAERQPSPDYRTWTGKEPDIQFNTSAGDLGWDGWIELDEFCALAGLTIHPEAEIS